ncbi:MAG: sigma-70 family RNA polymerase sigma factor, partial [Actinomycetota bacterium]|nr:sigma-70 family RNA polymerase sigma factor [Actinomycetota bacterium]
RHVAAKPAHDPVTDDLVTVPGPEDDLERLDRGQALRSALDALPQQQARVWVLRQLGNYSYDEIATELDIPVSTVRGALVQARKRILHAMGGEP